LFLPGRGSGVFVSVIIIIIIIIPFRRPATILHPGEASMIAMRPKAKE
jgi:hypothetical protein